MKCSNALFQTLEIPVFCKRLPYIASDRKTYQIDYANYEGIYRITQCLRSKGGIRDFVLSVFTSGKIPEAWPKFESNLRNYVYILRCDWLGYEDVYKIGRSRTPDRRISHLDHQFPFSFTVVACCKVFDAKRIETRLHKRFSSQRVRNEWFRLSDDDLAEALNIMGQQAQATSQWLGIDLATGQKLLEEV